MIESLLLGQRGPSRLVTETAGRTDDPSSLRLGVVTQVTSRGITVAIAGGEVAASHLGSYAPAVGDNVAMMQTQDTWLALGRVVGAVTPTDNQVPGSAAGPTLLAGMVTGGNSTLASSASSVDVVVPKFTLTYFQPANHHVLIMTFFTWFSNNSSDWIIVDVLANGVGVGEFVQPQVSSTFGRTDNLLSVLPASLYGGKKITITMTMHRLTGAGTTQISEVPQRPGFMFAFDMGDRNVFPEV
jgi:hypothetical protein